MAREVSGVQLTAKILKANDPPLKGTIDQQPVILESEVSTADAAKLHTKINAELDAEPKDATTNERRFVFIPKSDTRSSNRHGDEDKQRKTSTGTKDSKTAAGESLKRNGPRYDSSVPSLERRRSRTDLPALETKLESPPFRRSTSAYAYTPTSSNESAKTARPAAADFLLSPESIPYKGQGRGKVYFDAPVTTPRQHSVGGPLNRASTPLGEKRRSGGSQAGTPTGSPILEKRSSGGFDAYGRVKYDNPEKLTRPQQLSGEEGTRRSDRHSSTQSDRLDLGEDGRNSRKSPAQSSREYYTESDSDLADSSDSEPEKRRRKHRHHKHRRHQDASLRPEDDRDRHSTRSTRSSVEAKPSGRYASPLPSPKVSPSQLPPVDRKDTLRDNFPSSRDARKSSSKPDSRPVSPNSPYDTHSSVSTLDVSRQKQSGRSRSRRSSPVDVSGTRTAGILPSTLPIPIPTRIDLHSPGETRRSPSIPQFDGDSRPAGPNASAAKPDWQPPQFKPEDSQHLEQPVGSYRRYSQDIEDGNIAPLPPCPRIAPVAGKIDWLTLPKCPSFNICPSCFESTMAPTEFKHHFIPAPMRSVREKIACDFGSQPWYRIAWLLTRQERRRDLKLFYELAEVSDTTALCVGKHEAIRKWHSVPDPDNGLPVRNFDVCIHCVRSIEVLLPSLRGVFVRTDHLGPPNLPRVCDMRFDSKRFIHYFDALETMADVASNTRHPPDSRKFAALARRFASLPECPLDETLEDSRWYTITQLPEFTVCAECFEEVVVPGLKKKKAIPLMFNREMKNVGSASCQLYSARMRELFLEAVDGSDYKMLAAKARERRAAEIAWKKSLETNGHQKGSTGEKDKAAREWRKLE